jgi:hypothetical protein
VCFRIFKSMNSEVHAIVGGAAAALFHIMDAKKYARDVEVKELVGSALIGACTAIIPDFLEYSKDSNNRGILSSLALSSLPLKYLKEYTRNPNSKDSISWIKNAASIGYLSNLALEGMTPKRNTD